MIGVVERYFYNQPVGGGGTDFQLHGPTDNTNGRYASAIVREIWYRASQWNYAPMEIWNVWQTFATGEDPDQLTATFRSADYETGSPYWVWPTVVNDAAGSSFVTEPTSLSDDFNSVILKPGERVTLSFPGDLGIVLGPASAATDPVLGFLRYTFDPGGHLEDAVAVRILLEI